LDKLIASLLDGREKREERRLVQREEFAASESEIVSRRCVLSVDVPGKLRCVCTTPECQRDGTATCQADNFCYVQVIPPVSSAPSARSPDDDDVTRGCIDDDTPLLCENKRPSTYRGAWPVLHCCTQDWCNRHVVPTLPPWASHVKGNHKRPTDLTL